MTSAYVVTEASPLGEDLHLLFTRHTADMHAETPPESIHMMDASTLAAEDVRFFVLRQAGIPQAMGAIKRIDDSHAEIKSMHVLREARGRGLSRVMVETLIDAARENGFRRLSLETGVESLFEPARQLYAKMGFEPCGPYGEYWDDPNSYFMTREI